MGERQVLELAANRSSPRAARQWVDSVLHKWSRDGAIDRLALIASELVTSAVLQSSARITLALEAFEGAVRLEVRDGVRLGEPSEPGAEPTNLEEGGLGLPIVEALASSWGRTTTETGTSMWAEVRG